MKLNKKEMKEIAVKLVIGELYEMEKKYQSAEVEGIEKGLGKHKLNDGREVFIQIKAQIIK